MSHPVLLAPLRERLRTTTPTRHVGRITQVQSGSVEVRGLNNVARLGDELRLGHGATTAEVTGIQNDGLVAMAHDRLEGMAVGTPATLIGRPSIAPAWHWLGRVVDPFGNPLDGRPLSPGPRSLGLNSAAPEAHGRRTMGERLQSGIAVLDTMLPIARGQRVGLFAGSGVGKSTLLGRLAQNIQADVCVIAMIGERGREVREFLDHTLGPEGLRRSIVVAATSDMPAGLRRRALPVAMSIAEYFRDQGKHVLFLADSITRFAEAHREVAAATGEPSAMRGYPASLTPALAQLCERAGPGPEGAGDITAVLSVLVAGSDMEEPVADILRGLLDGHIVLSRKIAEAGQFPAVDVLRSVSRSLPKVATDQENAIISETRRLIGAFENSELMIQSGLYSKGTDPLIDRAIDARHEFQSLFRKTELEPIGNLFHQLEAIQR